MSLMRRERLRERTHELLLTLRMHDILGGRQRIPSSLNRGYPLTKKWIKKLNRLLESIHTDLRRAIAQGKWPLTLAGESTRDELM